MLPTLGLGGWRPNRSQPAPRAARARVVNNGSKARPAVDLLQPRGVGRPDGLSPRATAPGLGRTRPKKVIYTFLSRKRVPSRAERGRWSC